MASLRDLKSVPPATTQANKISWAWFVRLDLPSPIGTKRFSDYPVVGGNSVTFDIGDGAGSQSWDVTMPFKVGSIKQSILTPRDVAQISFGNQDAMPGSWTTWSNTLKAAGLSLTGSRCRIYMVWFDPATGQPYATQPELGDYDLDNHALGNDAQFALIPHVAAGNRPSPWSVPGPLCPYRYLDGETCQALMPQPGAAAAIKIATLTGFVDLGTSNILKPIADYAVSAWIYVLDETATGTIFANSDNGTNTGIVFRYSGNAAGVTGAIALRSINGDGVAFSNVLTAVNATTMIRPRTWSHVAVSYNSATKVATFFINGISVDTQTHTRNPIRSGGTIHSFIGTAPANLVGMTGMVDEVRYYNSQLTPDQVAAIYTASASAPAAAGYWRCIEGSGTTVADASGNGNTGTLGGTAAWTKEPTGETACAKTFKNCTDRANNAFFGGDHLMPKLGEKIPFGTTASPPSGV
jgi:hypothetical protein